MNTELKRIIDEELPCKNEGLIDDLIDLCRCHYRLQNTRAPEYRTRKIEKRIRQVVANIGLPGVQFYHDPRGNTVKLLLKSGRTNDWAHTGWLI